MLVAQWAVNVTAGAVQSLRERASRTALEGELAAARLSSEISVRTQRDAASSSAQLSEVMTAASAERAALSRAVDEARARVAAAEAGAARCRASAAGAEEDVARARAERAAAVESAAVAAESVVAMAAARDAALEVAANAVADSARASADARELSEQLERAKLASAAEAGCDCARGRRYSCHVCVDVLHSARCVERRPLPRQLQPPPMKNSCDSCLRLLEWIRLTTVACVSRPRARACW